MFEKAKIEIYEIELDDIITNSLEDFDDFIITDQQ